MWNVQPVTLNGFRIHIMVYNMKSSLKNYLYSLLSKIYYTKGICYRFNSGKNASGAVQPDQLSTKAGSINGLEIVK
jgi:hypothetical protein